MDKDRTVSRVVAKRPKNRQIMPIKLEPLNEICPNETKVKEEKQDTDSTLIKSEHEPVISLDNMQTENIHITNTVTVHDIEPVITAAQFHNKLLQIHFGTNDPQSLQQSMARELCTIQNIHEKKHKGDLTLIAEEVQYYQSRYYALMVSQLQGGMHPVAAPVAQSDIDIKLHRYKLTVLLLQNVMKEIKWFGKVYFNHYQHFWCKTLKQIEHGMHMDIGTQEEIRDKLNKNINIKLNKGDTDTCAVHKAWVNMCKQIWPKDVSLLIDDIVQKVIKSTVALNEPEWAHAVSSDKWEDKFIDIMDIKHYSKKPSFKNLLWIFMGQTKNALFKLLTMTVQNLDELSISSNSCIMWHFEQYWIAIKFITTVWCQILRKHWTPYKFLNNSLLDKADTLGLDSMFMGLFGCFGLSDPQKWKNWTKFMNTTIPVPFYGLSKMIQQLHRPECFETVAINQFQYNPKGDENHWTNKLTPVLFMYTVLLYEYHIDVLKKLWNNGRFDQDKDFLCNLLGPNQQPDAIQQVYNSYKTDSCKLPDTDENAVKKTAKQLSTIVLDMYHNPKTINLSTYSANGQHVKLGSYPAFVSS